MELSYSQLLDEIQRVRIELHHVTTQLEQTMAVTNYERNENRKLKDQIDMLKEICAKKL